MACENVVQAYFYLKIEIFFTLKEGFLFWLREFTLTLEILNQTFYFEGTVGFTQLDETCKLNFCILKTARFI